MRHPGSRLHRPQVLLCCAVITTHLGAPCSRAEALGHLSYLQGNDLYRLSLADMHATRVLSFPKAVDPADVRAVDEAVVWVDRSARHPVLETWNGTAKGRIELEPQRSADLENMAVDYDEAGEISALEPAMKDLYYDEFLLSPDGAHVAWNVNVVRGVSPEEAVTAHARHLVYSADIGGKVRTKSLAQDFSVAGTFADHGENRRLIGWSKADPKWVYFTRFEEQQLSSGDHGLWRANLESGAVEAIDAALDRVLALSDDERWVAHTPNDESCCGGINQTNNRVLVRDLRTGGESVVFDEWGEFRNPVREPGDEGATEEFVVLGASFSPDARWLAVTLRRWSSEPEKPSRVMTTVRAVAGGRGGPAQEGRCALGWDNGQQVVLGECRASDDGAVHISGSVFLYDPAAQSMTALPIQGVSPLGPGYAPYPTANR